MARKIEKKGFSADIIERTKRDKLEIIVDTCAASKNNFNSFSKLLKFVENESGYKKVRLVVPLQIGAELKQKIFSDFLEKTLESEGEGAFHGFYKKHQEIIRIVDTPDSEAYKYFFAGKALKKLKDNSELSQQICKEALELSKKYFPGRDKYDERFFIRKLNDFKHDYKNSYADYEAKYKKACKKIDKHYQDESSNFIDMKKRAAREKRLAREGSEFFADAPDSYRLLLQAMYSNSTIYGAMSADKEFEKIRHDRGERAIESYLYNKRSESDPSVVSIVVSDDQGARSSIQRLRQNTQNTVFTLSVYGFNWAMVQLGIINKIEDGMSRIALNDYQKKAEEYKKYAAVDERAKYNYRNPEVEMKWARRFVEVIKFGYWRDERSQVMAK